MNKPRICVVITSSSYELAVDTIKRAHKQQPDLIEIRLDYLKEVKKLEQIRESSTIPLIATNRPIHEHGFWKKNESDRIQTLIAARDAGFEYIDVELSTESAKKICNSLKSKGTKIIISHHDYDGTPTIENLRNIMHMELDTGAEVCKIVGTARNYSDNMIYLKLLMETIDKELVCFGMGASGILSRVLSPLFGGAYTYASTGVGEESASGQLTIQELKSVYSKLGV